MVKAITLDFGILDNFIEHKCGGKEYFLGGWSPDEIIIKHGDVPDNIELLKGKNWFAVRNGADKIRGLLHQGISETEPQLTVFKGYLSEEAIHSYSSAERVKNYWSTDLNRRHNGVFAAVTVSEDGSELSLISDIFGLGQLYQREEDELVLFSSAPGLMSLPTDVPDKISWVLRSHYDYIPGKETLVERVETIIPGSIRKFSKHGVKNIRWYDHKDFPSDTSVLDVDAMRESERALSKSIDRCAALNFGKQVLPLTSGSDSRRILAHLMDQNIDFEATTVRMPEPTGEDVDAALAELIAKDHNFKHTILEMPSAEQWSKDEQQKIFCFDAQAGAHTWSVDFFRHYHDQQICFYDGVGGDVYSIWPWDHEVETIDNVPHKIPFFMNAESFPAIEMVGWRIKDLQMPVSYGDNRALITSILMATKNRTIFWAQQQTKPGQITVCPYFDLDYIEVMLRYIVDEYEDTYPQQMILKEFWPDLAEYPNSRDFEEDVIFKEIPQGMNKIDIERNIMQDKADLEILKDSFKVNGRPFHYDELVNSPSKITLFFARYFPKLRDRIRWWFVCASHIMLWWQSRPYVIAIDDDEK